MDRAIMRARVGEGRVGHLATVGPDGEPHVVPICFALVGDTVYSAVDNKPKRSPRLRRLANIEATARASLLVDSYDEDWSRLWWVRLDGRARVVSESMAVAVAALVAKYEQYAERPPAGPVIVLEADRWSGWSAT